MRLLNEFDACQQEGQRVTGRSVLCVLPKGFDADLDGLRHSGWEVQVVSDLHAAARALKESRFLVGLLVQTRIDDETLEKTDEFLRHHGGLEWVGAFASESLASRGCRDLILSHLFDHHTLPLDPQRLAHTLGHAYGHAVMRAGANRQGSGRSTSAILGESAVTRELLRNTRRVAKVDAPVLIRGESGSGKELTAQEIHQYSRRAAGPFVAVNCGAIQASLIQSELFGHARGAFTGADRDKAGLIEAASGGTLFLDEIGDLPRELQINLLRFLQEKTITRVGSTRSVQVDLRVIAATNVDLESAVASGEFREDLFYRLNVLSLRVPPLRERSEDLPLLCAHFQDKFNQRYQKNVKSLTPAAYHLLIRFRWPGNVRELENAIERAVLVAKTSDVQPQDLPETIRGDTVAEDAFTVPPHHTLAEIERMAVLQTLQRTNWNKQEAAQILGLYRPTLYSKIKKHDIKDPRTPVRVVEEAG